MIRLLTILALFAPPLLAVRAEFDARVQHGLRIESAGVRAHIVPANEDLQAHVTFEFTLFNEADELDEADELNFNLVIPARAVPKQHRKQFKLVSEDFELADTALADGEFACPVTLADNQRVTIRWEWTDTLTRLPNEHPLGRYLLTLPLQYIRGFVALPERLDVKVSYADLPDELFGRDEPLKGSTIDAGVSVEGRFVDFEYRLLGSTLSSRLAVLEERLASFNDEQRTPENRSYTEALVLSSELHELAGDYAACATACATLAKLEEESGVAITHCGPWAKWRTYVPWALKHVAANKSAGAAMDAAAAKAAMQERWNAFLNAREARRPFDQFDADRYGNYWDYDWDRTRELYAEVLEILGEEDAAADVRETGGSDE